MSDNDEVRRLFLAEQIRRAYLSRDLDVLAPLLADDVRWGNPESARGCSSRADVLEIYGTMIENGIGADIQELVVGAAGILCALSVRWPPGLERPGDRHVYHVYMVRHGRIEEIRRYGDRDSAAVAAGLPG